MFEFIDRIARAWMNFRVERAAKKYREEFQLKRISADEHGAHIVGEHPAIPLLADEAAALLIGMDAPNYVEFDMITTKAFGVRPIRVTVEWADGKSPGRQVEILKAEIRTLKEVQGMLDNPSPAA